MTKTSAGYFQDELLNWFKTLDFCRSEIPEYEARMVELIQRNPIPELSANAETLLNQLADLHNQINLLQMEIKQQKNGLSQQSRNNGSNDDNTMVSQNALRERMQVIEKDFVETKYTCHQFLASTYNAS